MTDVTIDDTLRQTYANLRGAFESDFEAPTQTQAAATPAEEEENAPVVDETAQEVESTDAEGQEQAGAEEAESESPEAQEQQSFRPPWKKAALAEWEKLPEITRKEIERRENDFHKGIEQYKTGAQQAQEWERTVQPYLATIQSFGVTPQTAVNELLKADHLLRYSAPEQKVGHLLRIANDFGIDIQSIANGIQRIAGEQVWQQQNPVDPRMQALQQQVGQLQQQILQSQHQAQTAEHSTIDAEIAAFAADPDHEHFGVLQQDMALLLQAGKAKDLDSAYEMAMRANPQTYQIWLAQQQQEWDAQRKAKVAKARQAGANVVRPNGRASTAQSNVANETMEQTLERVAREQGLIN
jgi:hypothetical protein